MKNWFKNPLTGAMTMKAKLGIGLALLIALAIALGSAYLVGLNKGKNISEVEITQYEGRVKKLNADLATARARVTTKVVTEYVRDLAYQDRIVYRNRDIIRSVPSRGENLSKGWVYAHNQSVNVLPIDFDLARDTTPSKISDAKALDTIAENYRIGNKAITQLEALQKWITETWKVSKETVDKNAKEDDNN